MYLLFRPKHKITYIRLTEFSNARISSARMLEFLLQSIESLQCFLKQGQAFYYRSSVLRLLGKFFHK